MSAAPPSPPPAPRSSPSSPSSSHFVFDPDRMVAADFAFMAKQTQRFQINLGLGALIGGAGVYAATRAAQGGRASRVLGAILGIAGGASAGVILSVRGVIGDLADLPKDSQVKAFSAAILKDKYPMATAEWMAEQQKTSAHTPTTPAKPTTK